MRTNDRFITAAIVGGAASGLSEYLMVKYRMAGLHEPNFAAVLRGAIAGVVAAVVIKNRKGRRG